jgi:hypothetical protein
MEARSCQTKLCRDLGMWDNHVVWHEGNVKKIDRNRLNDHQSGLLWFTGLGGRMSTA